MRPSRPIPIKRKPSFAIVIDGETEFWYFQMLVRNEKDKLNVHVKPELPSKKALIDQFNLVKELAKDYPKTFWIIDLDVILKETREAQKGAKTRIQEFNEYINIIRKDYSDNVVVIVNNPCLEFWMLLHYETTSKYYDTCLSAEKQLKKHLPDYQKTEKYFTKQDNDIYLRLKPNLNEALKNSKKLGSFNINESTNAMAEMRMFFEDDKFGQTFKK